MAGPFDRTLAGRSWRRRRAACNYLAGHSAPESSHALRGAEGGGSLRADANGEIHLDGYYCTPMTIVTYGSDVAIRGDSRYTLVRKDNGAHPFVLLGEPYEEIWKNLDK